MGLQSSKRSRKMLNILIVYAHQLQHKSFNGALKDTAVEMLRKQGHNVVVSDLYSQKFNPVASKVDIGRTGKGIAIIHIYSSRVIFLAYEKIVAGMIYHFIKIVFGACKLNNS